MRLETRPHHVERAVRSTQPQDPPRDGLRHVPAGTLASAYGGTAGWAAQAAAATALGQASNGRFARHMACNTTPSLRATATAARLKPRRCTSPTPQVFGLASG